MDVHSKNIRSYNMSMIKSKDTKPELLLRKILWNKGIRYRLHYKKLPGKPDITITKQKKVIFVNGCFWHRHNCKYFKWPKTNSEFWKEKIQNTVLRDALNYKNIKELGWDILIIWECEIKNDLDSVIKEIENYLNV